MTDFHSITSYGVRCRSLSTRGNNCVVRARLVKVIARHSGSATTTSCSCPIFCFTLHFAAACSHLASPSLLPNTTLNSVSYWYQRIRFRSILRVVQRRFTGLVFLVRPSLIFTPTL